MARRPFEVTDDQRRVTRGMMACGHTHEQIAAVVGLKSPKSLRKHFREELDLVLEANRKVAQCMYENATSGKDLAATIFWLKCRGAWRELTNKKPAVGGGPVNIRFADPDNPGQELSWEEWSRRRNEAE